MTKLRELLEAATKEQLAAALIEAWEALENTLGYLDTPIGRRKLGVSPDEEWLCEARKVKARIDAILGERDD